MFCPIAFQANNDTISLDLLLRSIRWGHVSNGIRTCPYNKIIFLQVVSCGPISRSSPKQFWEHLGLTAVPTRKARLVGLLLALTRQASSALLELSSPTSTSWHGFCWQADWAPYQLSTLALAPWDCSWSLQGHGPNSTASSTSGSLKRIFCCWWLVCSDMLACPWWSLDGLLAAAQNWPISYQKVLEENSSACRHSCLENKNPSACWRSCRAPVEDGLWIHNAIGRPLGIPWVKKEEEQINIVLFVTIK